MISCLARALDFTEQMSSACWMAKNPASGDDIRFLSESPDGEMSIKCGVK